MTRYQDSNRLIQIWRLRWYILVPFKWLWYKYLRPFKVYHVDIETGEEPYIEVEHIEAIKLRPLFKKYGIRQTLRLLKERRLVCPLWSLLIGDAQTKMDYTWTHEEVMEKLKDKINERG
jgi:hypothetical protein